MYKDTYLFDISQLERRKVADQAEFERTAGEFLSYFNQVVDEAMDDMTATRDSRDPLTIGQNWPSVEMNGLIIGAMARKFPEYLQETGRGKGLKFVIEGKYEVYIKKLDGKTKMPSYNHTYSSKAICEQATIGGESKLPVIFVGYCADMSFENVTGYFAVCTKPENGISWITDIETMNGSDLESRINAITPVGPLPTVSVKAKTLKEAK